MSELNKPDNHKFSDYIYVLFKWKKLIFLNLVVVIAASTVFAFMIPEKFKATSTIMVPQDNSMGGLSGIISGNPLASFGAKLFGISNTTEDIIVGLLYSRTSLSSAIDRFNLMEYYEIDDKNMDKALKAFASDVVFEPNENGFIEISVITKDPELSARISNFFVHFVDSLNIGLNIRQAKNNREFIEKRYLKNVMDLKAAEDSLYRIQKKYGFFSLPEQLEATVKAAAEIEALLVRGQIELELMEKQYGTDLPQYIALNERVNILKQKVNDIKYSKQITNESNILFPFADIPEMGLMYFRNYREVELQGKIMEFILPMYEQAKVEEQKSIPTILIIDKAEPPQLKHSPKKALIIIGGIFFSLFFLIPLVFRAENIYGLNRINNPLEEKEYKFYKTLVKLYRINIDKDSQ